MKTQAHAKASSTLDYIKNQRGMPWVEIDMVVEVDGKKGLIKGGLGGNLSVLFEGAETVMNAHPYWKTKYYDRAGRLIAVDGKRLAEGTAVKEPA